MFKFGRKYYANKYKLVYFQPSIEDLKKYILQLEGDFDGRYSILKRNLEYRQYTSASELINNNKHLFDLVNWLFDDRFPDYLIGIKNLETGEIKYKFHSRILGYRPNEGYVIVEKHNDLDCHTDYMRYCKILSLKTGEEFEGFYDGFLTGIENLKFCALKYSVEQNIGFSIFEIDEEHQTINNVGNIPLIEMKNFRKLDYLNSNEFEIEELNNTNFYKNDDSFSDYERRQFR